jgi:amino acid adenylation domain-containing protein
MGMKATEETATGEHAGGRSADGSEASPATGAFPLPATSLVSRFEEVVRRQPGTVALTLGGKAWSYAELNASANRVAHRLLGRELPANSIVALWLGRNFEAISVILGILKAGHTYLPLDATYPVARIVQTLEDAQPALVIAEPELAAKLVGDDIATGAANILLVSDALSDTGAEEGNPDVATKADALAYVIYTSGSTGQPKGVCVTHTNVLRLLDQTSARFEFNERDIWTLFHSLAFDFSVWEMWGALLHGATLVPVPYEVTRSPEDFYRLLSEERVTVLNQTPSAFSLLSQVEDRGTLLPLGLRLVIFGGEALQFAGLKSWFSRHDDTRPQLVNCFGITETTVHVTTRNVTQADALFERDSLLGEPIADLRIHLCRPDGQLVAEGEIGEICVAGAGVARGYLHRPELTAERFVPELVSSSESNSDGGRMYRSGDLARRRRDGELVYLGRRDQQVKINGFRIELGEVEAALCSSPGVLQACVRPHQTGPGATQLAAYVVPAAGEQVRMTVLAASLAKELPPQMLPAFYTTLPALPLTPNGKVDFKALPAPRQEQLSTGSQEAEAGSEIEQAVLKLVREVVGSQSVGLEDNFFTVGGHSLLGTQFVMRARRAFGVKLTLRDIFETDSVSGIAGVIEELILAEIDAMPEEEALRLSGEPAARGGLAP